MTITIFTDAGGPSSASKVNTDAADNQLYPAATALAGGGYIVTWQSNYQDGSQGGVYFQRYDASGAKVGGETRANATAFGDQISQSISALSDGGFVISWLSSLTGQYVGMAQRFDASGAPVGPEFQVNASGIVRTTTVAGLSGGGFVAGWQTDIPDPHYVLQRFDASGVRTGSEVTIATADLPNSAVIKGLTDGGFLVTWMAGSSGADIFSQRFDAGGAAVGTVTTVNTYTAGEQNAPSLAVLADGGWVVTWESSLQDPDGSRGIYYQQYDASGAKVGTEGRVNTGAVGDQWTPSVAALSSGFVITWNDRSQANAVLKGQVFNAAGAPVGSEVTISTGGEFNGYPSVVATSTGYAVSWMGYASLTPPYMDIFTRSFAAPVVSSNLTADRDAARGDGADDILTMTPATLTAGDTFDGGGGHDTLQAAVTGTYDFTGVTLTSVETILGSSGDDTFIFDGGLPAGVTFDSGGGHDTAVVSADVDLDDVEATGDWTLAAASGSDVTFTIHDTDGISHLDGHGANVVVDATTLNLTAEDRATLFENGIGVVHQAGGITFTADGGAPRLSAISKVSSLSDNGQASIAALAGGGYVLTWATASNDVFDVHARLYTDAGVAAGPELSVNTTTADHQLMPSVAALAGGRFVVTWQSAHQGGQEWVTEAQLFDASGAKIGAEFTVGSPVGSGSWRSDVTALDGGGFAVAWASYPNGGTVYVDRYDANGVRVGSQIQVSNDIDSHDYLAITGLAGGGFAVAWNGGANSYHRAYDAAGQPLSGANFISTADLSAWDIHTTGLSDGTYLVTWTQAVGSRFGQGFAAQLYLQRFNADGSAFSSAVLLADDATAIHTAAPPTATDDGGYIITWRVNSSVDFSNDIYAQRFDASGAKVSDATLIDGASGDNEPVAAQTTSGALVFAWTASLNGNVDTQINQRLITEFDYHVLTTGADAVNGKVDDTLVVGAPGDINAGDNLVGGAGGTDRLELTRSGSVNLAALAGFSGFEQIVGASGDDTLIVGGSTLNGVTSIDGRTGLDVIQMAANTLNLSGATLSSIELIAGTSGADTIIGSAGDDTIAGFGGADSIDGGAGVDTADYSASGSAVTVNLTTNVNTGGDAQGDVLLRVENLIGSAFGDTLSGDGGANRLDGGGGVDTASYADATAAVQVSLAITGAQNTGGAGLDTLVSIENLTGSAFNDTLTGDAGANVLNGGNGNDTLQGGAGDDTLIGGAGVDAASYVSATSAVTVSLAIAGAQNTLGAGVDTLVGIENLIGSAFNDTLTGDAGDNVLIGGLGNDTLDGGGGSDTASYVIASGGVTVSLAVSGPQNTGGAGTDTLVNIENLAGSQFNDILAGNAGDNILAGGQGIDTVSYGSATAGVTVDLSSTAAQNTVGAGTDTLSGFENVNGSAFADTLYGSDGDNVIDGAAGTDTASYARASAGVTVSLAISGPQNTVGAGTDTLISIENLTGSAFNDVLAGNAGDNVLNGGGGIDAVTYAAATAGVSVSLSVGGPQNTGGAGIDTLISIENLYGSAFDDVIEGDGGENYLNAGAGNDTISYASAAGGITIDLSSAQQQITGGAGTDTLIGFENVTGSAFNDTLIGTSGANVFNGGGGADTVSYANINGAVNVSLALAGAQNTGAGGVDTLTSIENLTGTSFSDILAGNAGDNVLNGGLGNDTVSYAAATAGVTVNLNLSSAQNTGGAGTDTLLSFENIIGSAFNDVLTLGTAATTTNAGAGNDTLILQNGGTVTGGAGQDAYLINYGAGLNGRTVLTITDFQAGNGGDRLDLSDFLAHTDWDGSSDPFDEGYLQLVQTGTTVTLKVDLDGGGDTFTDLVVLQNVSGAALTAANFSGLAVGPITIDAPGNTSTGIVLGIGQSIQGSISPGSDTDWFRVELTAGQSYLFTVNGTGGAGLGDPIVRVRDSAGNVITFDDDGGPGLDAAVRFTPTTSGTYFIEADSVDDTPGNYTISAQAVAPQNPLDTIDLGFTLPSSTVSIYFAQTGESFNGHTADRSWNSGEIAAAMQAWGSFSTYVNLNFVQASSAAAATVVAILDDLPDNTVGLAELGGIGALTTITFDPAQPFWSNAAIAPGGVAYETMIHEMGHVLGLAHPHDDSGDSQVMEGVTDEFDSYGVALLNQTVFTVMSYNDGWPSQNNGPNGFGTGYSETPMALDVALLQQKYGARANNTGDSAYDLISPTGSSGFSTIWDTGGTDTIANSGSQSAHIDLRAATLLNQAGGGGYVSYLGSGLSGFTIAAGVQIENAVGGSAADVIIGNALNNILTGRGGGDVMTGGGGDDIFRDTVANFNGDTITDLSVGDRIQFLDANLGSFNFSLIGSLLTYSGGSMTLSNLAAGYHLAASAASQGVALSLAQSILNNGLSGDFNGDGKDDLLWRSDSGQMSNWLGQANGGFVGNDANAFASVPTSWKIIGAGDFNGDGRDDILWRSDTGQMSNWLGTASGGWLGNDANAFVNVPNDWKVAGVGDFNGDGKSDLLWRSDSGLMSNWLGTASGGWLANDANAFSSVPTNWHIIGVGDFNGDHRDDILWRSDTGQMSNWLGQANGGFVGNDANAFVNVPTDWHIVGVGDFNGDGKSDLLWRSDSGLMSNWLGKANGGWTPNDANALTSVPTDWVIAAVGDYNGDGKDDIMWRHSSGAMSNWLGQANGGFVGNDANAYAVVSPTWHIQADNMFGI